MLDRTLPCLSRLVFDNLTPLDIIFIEVFVLGVPMKISVLIPNVFLFIPILGAMYVSLPQDVGLPHAKIRQSIICCPGDSVVLDGWASVDPGGEIVQWLWDIGADGSIDVASERGETALLAPEEPRTYIVVLKVRDNDGNLSKPDSSVLSVMNSSPKVQLSTDTTVMMGARVSFHPKIRTTCGSVAMFEWDFDNDGTFEYRSRTNAKTSRVYYRQGRYRARLKVTDTNGREAGGMVVITVVPRVD